MKAEETEPEPQGAVPVPAPVPLPPVPVPVPAPAPVSPADAQRMIDSAKAADAAFFTATQGVRDTTGISRFRRLIGTDPAPVPNIEAPPLPATPAAPPLPVEMGKGKTKNIRKANPDRVKAAEEAAKKARDEFDRLDRLPNKTPEDKAARDKAKRELQRQLDRMKKSEEDTRTGKRN